MNRLSIFRASILELEVTSRDEVQILSDEIKEAFVLLFEFWHDFHALLFCFQQRSCRLFMRFSITECLLQIPMLICTSSTIRVMTPLPADKQSCKIRAVGVRKGRPSVLLAMHASIGLVSLCSGILCFLYWMCAVHRCCDLYSGVAARLIRL